MELVKLEQADPDIDTWEAFWLMYPRHEAKKAAKKMWDRIPSSKHTEILAALLEWRRVWLDRGEPQYIPLAGSWLNGERWEDEVPIAYRPRAVATTKIIVSDSSKSVMPEHVRALIAKLRSK